VGAHGAAEDDEAADPAKVAWERLTARDVEIAVMDPKVAQRVREQAQTLGRRMAQDQPGGSLARGVCVAVPASHALSLPTTSGQSRETRDENRGGGSLTPV